MLEHEKWLAFAQLDYKSAQSLYKDKLFPAAAYHCQQAAEKAQEILNVISIDADDRDTLMKVAMTAMTGKGAEDFEDHQKTHFS